MPTKLQSSMPLPDSGFLAGPTGKIFPTPQGNYATELMTTVELDGKYHNIPLVIPNQYNLDHLLKGGRPQPRHIRTAVDYAVQNNALGKGYPSLDEALAAETKRHKLLEQKFRGESKFRTPQTRYLGDDEGMP